MPRSFPTDGDIIASFWADSDTRTSGTISYGINLKPEGLLSARARIQSAYPNEGESFTPSYLFVVTWENVGYLDMHNDSVRAF